MTNQGWGSTQVAQAWKEGAAVRSRAMAALTKRMLDEAGVSPGMRVLDLGTGAGEVALVVAARVGETGSVVAVDSSPSMIEAARQAVTAAGVGHVTVLSMDVGDLKVDARSFDAVVGRHVLMFADVPRALAGVARALRPGGRFAATVWGPLAGNPFHRAVIEAARARGGWGEPTPEVVRAFARQDAAAWTSAMGDAGLEDARLDVMMGERQFESAEEALAGAKASPLQREPIERLPEGEREGAWREVEREYRAYGGVFPCEYWLLGGRAGRSGNGAGGEEPGRRVAVDSAGGGR